MYAVKRPLWTQRLWVLRLLAGVLVMAICFQWGSRQDLQQWLFPFVFATGLLTTWVTGPRWGWLVTTGYLVAQGSFYIANAIRGPFHWFYHGNLVAAVLAQSETVILIAVFILVAGMGGLCGWAITAVISHLSPTRATRRASRD